MSKLGVICWFWGPKCLCMVWEDVDRDEVAGPMASAAMTSAGPSMPSKVRSVPVAGGGIALVDTAM